jgi:hypothetical protein
MVGSRVLRLTSRVVRAGLSPVAPLLAALNAEQQDRIADRAE